ncbi:hypothetical protein [Senegalia massiliensis]|nr:hypothetical protein [Senegalia massiliensis]
MKNITSNLVELSKEFIEFADKLYKDKKIDRETYIKITKTKKEFVDNFN